ncbi:MAG: response regulator [Planctomycetes bacterium]|nr:response regulator [Planctomycetota bacterium]
MNFNKVLIVVASSNKEKRQEIAGILSSNHYEVVEAVNGNQAVDLAGKYNADIVLTGVGIEGIDGFNVCKYIKTDPSTKDIAVIVYSVSTDVNSIVKALDVGADDYLIEPFEKQICLSKIEKVIGTVCRKNEKAERERRASLRKSIRSTVTWQDTKGSKFQITFKEIVIDLSENGMAFEHYRCYVCTGYLDNSVHPQCPFFENSAHLKKSDSLDFFITLPNKKIAKAKGKVVYVFQHPNNPKTERVGVIFTNISRQVRDLLRTFLKLK